MPDETSRRYLFVTIDCASRWVFLHIYDDQSEASSLPDSLPHAPDRQWHAIQRPLHLSAKAAFPARTPSTEPAPAPALSTVSSRCVISRQTAWLNALTDASANFANKHFASVAAFEETLKDYLLRTIASSRNRPSDIDLPLMPSHHGMTNILNCSLLRS
jgi:hypothetical protein